MNELKNAMLHKSIRNSLFEVGALGYIENNFVFIRIREEERPINIVRVHRFDEGRKVVGGEGSGVEWSGGEKREN